MWFAHKQKDHCTKPAHNNLINEDRRQPSMAESRFCAGKVVKNFLLHRTKSFSYSPPAELIVNRTQCAPCKPLEWEMWVLDRPFLRTRPLLLLGSLLASTPVAFAQFTGTAEVVESVPQRADSGEFIGVQVPGEALGGQQSTEGRFTGAGGSDPSRVAPDGRPGIFSNSFEG